MSCSTTTGPGTAVTVVVRPTTPIAAGGSPIAFTLGSLPAGIVVTPSTTQTLTTSNQTAGITFTIRSADGCAGATSGTNAVSFRFQVGGVNNATVSISHVVTATASALSATPTAVALTCVLNGSTYTPGVAQTVTVASSVPSASGGTPFTVDTSASGSTGAAATWATVTPTTQQIPNASASTTISVVAATGCGGFAVGTTNSTTVTLLNAPAPARVIPVTLRIIPPTTLSSGPASASLTYVKGSNTPGRADVTITAASGTPFFTVDSTSLPIWLTCDAMSGTAPRALRFSSTTVADTLAAGVYRATVRIRVANFGDLQIPVSLSVNNPPPRLTVSEGTTRNIPWTVGQPVPTLLITAASSDSPIPYTVTTGGNLAPIVAASQQSGLAYSFGSPIPVSFDPLLFASATPGNTLTGTVTLTWGNPSRTVVVTINVQIQSASATVSGISPATLPTAAPGTTFTLVLTGSEFISSSDPSVRTRVGLVSSGGLVNNTNIQANVVNGSNIILTIVAPAVADTALPFSPTGTGGSVVIGVCNPFNGVCNTPTGSAVLTIGNNPIVQGVTSASSYQQVNPPALQTVAPFDMISIFGSSFCSSNGTGCSSSQVLYGTPDPATLTYPRSISPDAAGASQRSTVVTFQTTGSTPTVIATAPILFGTNSQINVMAPAALSAHAGTTVNVVVSFGFGTGATQRTSAPFPVSIVATSPGLFTIGSNGQGDGAILDSNWAVVTPTNPAAIRTNAGSVSGGVSDTVQIYLTGLGMPSTGADNASAGSSGGAVWGTDCVSTSSFLTSLNANASSSLTSLDGTVILSSLLNTNRLVPCIASGSANSPTVTIGGRNAVVSYAGFLPDSIAGLYQINAKLPVNGLASLTDSTGATLSSITAPVQLPVIVTANSRSSQTGVNIWVAPRLRVTGPSGAGLTGRVGIAWASSNNVVAATEGTSPYRFAITSGVLPAGLLFNTATGAISGTPNANTSGTYQVTATAIDSANVPVTGTVSFTLTVAGGLVLASSTASPIAGTFGTANATVTTVSATGGVFPYTYAITTPSSLPTGMSINPATGVVAITALTPAGNYTVTVTATDSTSGTPLTGTVTFAINVGLLMTPSNTLSPTAGTGGPVRTITATGGTGTITYATATAGFTVDASTGVVSSTNAATAGSYTVIVTATDGTAAPGAASAATGTVSFTAVIQ
ncbi:MAG: putative Ig domain-containing protein [Bryobacteraceae bacterium]|nr:putative Ig domain-containing protein [Bryobacteraceae bacterium]